MGFSRFIKGTIQETNIKRLFSLLLCFDAVLEPSKENVLKSYNQYKDQMDSLEGILSPESVDIDGEELGFYNFSKYNFQNLLADPEHLEENLIHYIDSFSSNVIYIYLCRIKLGGFPPNLS
jgi:type I restriction enzyme M protein